MARERRGLPRLKAVTAWVVVALLHLPGGVHAAEPRAGSAAEDTVPAAYRQALARTAPLLVDGYAALLQAPLERKPEFSLSWSERAAPGRGVRAAVGAARVDFTLSGEGWATPSAEAMSAFVGGVAHELAHLWNAGVFRARPEEPSLLTEGNAELLAGAALLRLHIEGAEQSARRVNVAFNRCFVASAGRAWSALPRRDAGDVPASCGLAVQVVTLALAQQRDPALDAFSLWRGYWKRHPRYGAATFIEHLRSLRAEEAATFFASALQDAAQPLDRALVNGIERALGVQLPRAPAPQYAAQALANLMQLDCGGAWGLWTNEDHFFTDEVAGCAFFKGGWKLRYMAGVDLLRDPVQAVAKASQSCSASRTIVFRTLDAVEMSMPCDASVQAVLPTDLRVANLPPLRVARMLLKE
jgi:hypothetical protein